MFGPDGRYICHDRVNNDSFYSTYTLDSVNFYHSFAVTLWRLVALKIASCIDNLATLP